MAFRPVELQEEQAVATEDLTIHWKPVLVAMAEGLTTHFVLVPESPLVDVQ